mmetsp:Transcript_6192/g.14805  ORF Transcript_6192/g.14805 Transcript_6192/m.14805 type:complete len:105 (-) Transcript_6192:27-341(-)
MPSLAAHCLIARISPHPVMPPGLRRRASIEAGNIMAESVFHTHRKEGDGQEGSACVCMRLVGEAPACSCRSRGLSNLACDERLARCISTSSCASISEAIELLPL